MTSPEEYVATRAKEFELIRQVETLPGVLSRDFGYRCLQTGKFWEGHWRNGGFTEGMTTFEAPPVDQSYGGVRTLSGGERVAHGNGDWGLQIGRETMQPIKDFVIDCEEGGTPWMVWYAPYLPHQPHDSPERFFDLARSMPGVKAHEVPYFASIAQFDETVGELIEFVESHSGAKNTLFVFVSDNGWSPSQLPQKGREQEYAHTKTSKRAPFDEGVRSPILIRWDGNVVPATHHELVSSIDLMPTLLSAVGAAVETMPGINLLDQTVPEIEGSRAVFGAIYPGDAGVLADPAEDVAYRWVRRGDFKLIVTHGDEPWGDYLKSDALYHVATDPMERSNVIGVSNLIGIQMDLREALDAWWDLELP
tara:strand:+ start:212 stop:1303 length:1092 start_codon:yes stop_codon:yes gene_type:complete